jgi:hypothetical protein
MNKTNNNLDKIAAISIPGFAEACENNDATLDVAAWTAETVIRRAFAYGTKRGALETRKATAEFVADVAKKFFRMSTTERRGSDELDYHSVTVGEVRDAMGFAFSFNA